MSDIHDFVGRRALSKFGGVSGVSFTQWLHSQEAAIRYCSFYIGGVSGVSFTQWLYSQEAVRSRWLESQAVENDDCTNL
jgi:hypothetical protein